MREPTGKWSTNTANMLPVFQKLRGVYMLRCQIHIHLSHYKQREGEKIKQLGKKCLFFVFKKKKKKSYKAAAVAAMLKACGIKQGQGREVIY